MTSGKEINKFMIELNKLCKKYKIQSSLEMTAGIHYRHRFNLGIDEMSGNGTRTIIMKINGDAREYRSTDFYDLMAGIK